jgi:hypothetical protein
MSSDKTRAKVERLYTEGKSIRAWLLEVYLNFRNARQA